MDKHSFGGEIVQVSTRLTPSQTTFAVRPRYDVQTKQSKQNWKLSKQNKLHLNCSYSGWTDDFADDTIGQVVFGDTDDHGEKGGLNKLGKVMWGDLWNGGGTKEQQQ